MFRLNLTVLCTELCIYMVSQFFENIRLYIVRWIRTVVGFSRCFSNVRVGSRTELNNRVSAGSFYSIRSHHALSHFVHAVPLSEFDCLNIFPVHTRAFLMIPSRTYQNNLFHLCRVTEMAILFVHKFWLNRSRLVSKSCWQLLKQHVFNHFCFIFASLHRNTANNVELFIHIFIAWLVDLTWYDSIAHLWLWV